MYHKEGIVVRILNWNISYQGKIENKIDFINQYMQENTCVMLQEVKPHAFEYIKNYFGEKYNFMYSLDYRKPSKFDSEARKLGVLIILDKKIDILDCGVIERSPFPDRTIYATIKVGLQVIKVLALHSLTGCGYYRTKSVQYDSFAEFIDEYKPDIIGIDANEPETDHYDMTQMEFFDNGPGAKNFFLKVQENGLLDSYVKINNIVSNETIPLTQSHKVRRRGSVRYDFIFINKSIEIENMNYYYDEAVNAGSDHALLICNTKLD